MSSTEPATTSTTGDSSGTPPPSSEMNAVPAGDASKEKTKSKVPGGSESPSPEKSGSKAGGKGSRQTPSMARTVAPDKEDAGKDGEGEGSEEKEGSDAESEYETICIRRKKPTPFLMRIKRFLWANLAFDIYTTQVMWEAFKLVVITSQFNWALEIMAGILHILVAAGKCALKKQCTVASQQRKKSETAETDTEKTPEPDEKKASVKSASGKPSSKPGNPSLTKSQTQSKSGPSGTPSEPPTSTTESGPTTTTTTTESGPTTETSENKTPEPTGSPA